MKCKEVEECLGAITAMKKRWRRWVDHHHHSRTEWIFNRRPHSLLTSCLRLFVHMCRIYLCCIHFNSTASLSSFTSFSFFRSLSQMFVCVCVCFHRDFQNLSLDKLIHSFFCLFLYFSLYSVYACAGLCRCGSVAVFLYPFNSKCII